MARDEDRVLWAATQVIDWIHMGLICFLIYMLHGDGVRYSRPALAIVLAVQGAIATGMLWGRERIYFRLFGEKIALEKRKGTLSSRTLLFVFQTYAVSMFSLFVMCQCGIVWYLPFELSLRFWCETFLLFYVLLVLRDVFFLAPFHHIMHKHWYWMHKTHHEAMKNAQALHAYHIDVLDLVLENVGAPFLLFGAQYLLGWQVGFSWQVAILLTCHDGALHSINPYSVMYFNPALDHFLNPNIYHQLHHATSRGYLLFVPYHHVSARLRKVDTDEYNRLFKTTFSF